VHQQNQSQRDVDVGRREREPRQARRQPALPRHDSGRPAPRGREQEQAEEVAQQLRPGDHSGPEGRHREDMGVGDAVRFQRGLGVELDRRLQHGGYVRDSEDQQRTLPSRGPGRTEQVPNGQLPRDLVS